MVPIVFFARLVLGGVFLLSATTKIVAPGQFVQDVQNYRILPRPIATGFAWTLPYLELGVAALLLGGFHVALAAAIAVVMLISFMVAIGVAMVRGVTSRQVV